ncbi:MAG: phosphatase PAP2 family protein [Rhodoferax sp.]|nr:phosphatase PAP2 family protein [Rhodoferax sp.]
MRDSHPPLAWYRQLVAVVPQHLWLKATVTPLFIALFFGAYLYLLKSPVYPITVMPVTVLDQFIGFQPRAIWLYVSLWVYVSLPPALLGTRRELFDYAAAMAAACLMGLLIFYFWPTAVPAAQVDWALHPGMDFLKSMDAGGNAFPSLHVATAAFSAVWFNFILSRFGAPRSVLGLNWAWCAGIVYSTVAIRQHVVVDVIAGLVLGTLVAYLSLRRRPYVPIPL